MRDNSNSNSNSNRFLTLPEAANFLRLSKSTLYKLTHMRLIPFVKPNNGRILFDIGDLEKWIAAKKRYDVGN